jgi:hypothetical protein
MIATVAAKMRSRISFMSVELWKSIFDWATVALIALTVVSGAGALITGDIISKRQGAKLRSFDSELTFAKTELGKQQERAAKADERASKIEAGNLQLQTDLANATTESRTKQIALEIEQRKTAEAQLALRKAAEYAATPRRIIMSSRVTNEYNDQELRTAAFKELEKYADTPAVILYVQDEEAQILAGDIRTALIHAGWKSTSVLSLASTPIPLGFVMEGVQIRTWLDAGNTPYFPPPNATPPPVVTALLDLLKLDLNPPIGSPFGVRWEPEGVINGKHLTGLARYGFNMPQNGVVISVGRKPTEQLFWGIPDLPVKNK